MAYKLGSLFDGSGALCGIEPCWAAEVEPYPIAVTRTRFPNMKHLGDISKVNGAEIEPVDIITFGSPCQDLSVAGKRAGLKHEANGDEETTRSGLFMEAVRIIKEMREATNGEYPRFALWENVPGAFSSNNGEDFRIVCEELIKIVEPAAFMPPVPKNGWAYADSYIGDGWSLAYRTFDAQYWGVPQRRRRIHLVTDFRGERAREVLFERQGVRGYFAESGAPWQATARDAENRTGAADREGEGEGTADVRGRLDAVAYSFDSLASNSMKSSNPHSGCRQVEVAKTLDTTDPNPCKNQGGIAIAFAQNQRDEVRLLGDKSGSLQAQPGMKQQTFIVDTHILDDQGGSVINVRTDGKSPTLRAQTGGHLPIIMEAAGFCTEHSAKARGVGFQKEVAPTLRAGVTPAVVYDSRGSGDGKTANTLTGDHNNRITDYSSVVVEPVVFDGANVTSPVNASNPQPGDPCHTLSTDNRNILVEPVYCLQGNGIDRADTAGCNGAGWREGQSYTLNTIDRPAVAYSVDVGLFTSAENVSTSLLARQYKDPPLVSYPEDVQYIVRRLTPTECARLQGFADRHGDIEKKDRLTPEEFRFWHEVRNTHAAINGKKVQDYTEAQMLTWYNKLHTDSAEYKMWGNGIALPPALYCMQGIVDALNAEEDDSWML